MNEDRRRHARIKSTTIMQYKNGRFSSTVDTATKDVSLGGVCFFSDKKFKKGQIVTLKLYYDTNIHPKNVKGKIVWSTECHEGSIAGYLNGLTFIK